MYNFNQLAAKLDKSLNHLKSELAKLRTGKATIQLLDPVRVAAYGSNMALQEVARVSAPDPTMLVVSPYDPSLVAEIEKAIASSGLNLQPVVDKQIVRVSVPALTQERRKEMVKLLHQKIEEGKVMIRTIRTDTKRDIEKQAGSEGVSEDDIAAETDQLEDIIKKSLTQVDELAQQKELDLMTV